VILYHPSLPTHTWGASRVSRPCNLPLFFPIFFHASVMQMPTPQHMGATQAPFSLLSASDLWGSEQTYNSLHPTQLWQMYAGWKFAGSDVLNVYWTLHLTLSPPLASKGSRNLPSLTLSRFPFSAKEPEIFFLNPAPL